MSRQPIANGRLAYVSGTFQSNELGDNNQPKMKNRYATLGRVTAWPSENGSPLPQISIDLEALPVGMQGSTKLFIFWDEPNQQQGSFNQQQQPQPQSYGSWGNAPQQPHPNQNPRG